MHLFIICKWQLTTDGIEKWSKILSTSGFDSMSNILSTSSKTKNLTDENVMKPCWTNSFNLPGVATSIWQPS